jgi:hypothetical protein
MFKGDQGDFSLPDRGARKIFPESLVQFSDGYRFI